MTVSAQVSELIAEVGQTKVAARVIYAEWLRLRLRGLPNRAYTSALINAEMDEHNRYTPPRSHYVHLPRRIMYTDRIEYLLPHFATHRPSSTFL